MGGKALSCNVSIRLTKNNYVRLATLCVAKLQALYPAKRVAYLGSYGDKADFGDCDILLEGGEDYDPYKAAAALDAVEVVRNGPVTSVGVIVRPEVPHRDGNVFQVDLIKMEPEAFDFAMSYFGHGDTGNLLGRIAHAQGLSLRHDGLFYYYRDGDYKFRAILLTREFSEALTFMGYSPDKLAQGFDSQEAIYRYVASSPFFNRDIFLLENRNARSRVRDKKRLMYMGFLKWCEAHPELPAFVYPENKAAWLPRLVEFFPQFQAEYDQATTDLSKQRAAKAKYNGELVSQLTGLKDKELGALMARFKASFASAELQQAFLLASSPESIAQRILQLQRDMAS